MCILHMCIYVCVYTYVHDTDVFRIPMCDPMGVLGAGREAVIAKATRKREGARARHLGFHDKSFLAGWEGRGGGGGRRICPQSTCVCGNRSAWFQDDYNFPAPS